jgi:probable rRNA maturation factor
VSVICSDERPRHERDGVAIDVERWRKLAESALDSEGAEGELTVTFIGVDEIADLNLEHMGEPGPTDVLSFPLDTGASSGSTSGVPTLLGDVVVCPAVAAEQFVEHAGTLDDELALLVVHGVLHVLGHDHAAAVEATRMRDRELVLLIDHHWRGDPPAAFGHGHTRR